MRLLHRFRLWRTRRAVRRDITLTEAQAKALARAVAAVIDDPTVGLTDAQRLELRRAAASHLLEVDPKRIEKRRA